MINHVMIAIIVNFYFNAIIYYIAFKRGMKYQGYKKMKNQNIIKKDEMFECADQNEEIRLSIVEVIKKLEYEMDIAEHFINSYKDDSKQFNLYNYWIGRKEGYRKAIKIVKLTFEYE